MHEWCLVKGNKLNFTNFGSQHGHKVQGRAGVALAIKFPHFSLARAGLYSELRIVQVIFASCLKIIGPFPSNCIAPAYMVERNGTNGTERDGTPTP